MTQMIFKAKKWMGVPGALSIAGAAWVKNLWATSVSELVWCLGVKITPAVAARAKAAAHTFLPSPMACALLPSQAGKSERHVQGVLLLRGTTF